ncbi:urea ABC transporter permease subunit UrtB [Futiania mangrovi]|uniref:Urea ABC transporter permease subunit UrtB n=1 Tax=Futiania mangrovi TaxID=2959716 RepID=A0A9J6PCL0_9PROT|nr:urea ABC transporter permease subunit UrtB [Futiania mangrovii]MCP1337069.1 urea ABC transporter permease subunit UrtB [Futiania mangrovii]
MLHLLRRLTLLLCLLGGAFAAPVSAQDLRPLVDALGAGGFDETEQAIGALAATGDPRVADVLRALEAGDLYVRRGDNAVVEGARGGAGYVLTDPLTGEALGETGRTAVKKIRVNNNLRRAIAGALAGLTLMSPDAATRAEAAGTLLTRPDPTMIEALDAAIANETVAGIRQTMTQARAAAILDPASGAAEAAQIEAAETVAARGNRDALAILNQVAARSEGALADAARAGIAAIERTLAIRDAAQNVWYGISLGSVLLLAAIGLAITFGVMGVINMAHGEMVMIGAYTTFVVQEVIRTHAPWLFDASVLIAIPLAFLVAGAVGVAIERGVIRFLYGRPLETLLATWGLSLIIQQAVRTIFGASNRQVGAPSWMSGTFDLWGLAITWNRLYIVIFAILVFAVLVGVLRYTSFGLRLRAVTQNRRMAGSMGIRTPWVDAMTFGLGSGIAGMAGVALSQIDNVSPNLGQGYIIDSFMVVVFGGVGNLWGTLVGAFTLGIANKFLEPYAGAVLGKILVLVLIILFIQKRPRGLFALKGRAVEA